jgi:ABC-2 type transport system permease protein
MLIWTLAKKDLRLLLGDRRAVVLLLAMPVLFILVLGIALGDDRLRVSIVDLDKGEADPLAGSLAEPWSKVVLSDLEQAGGIRVEVLASREEAQRLVNGRKRAAVLVFGPDFSRQMSRCSFLEDGINPFNRDGVDLRQLDAELLRDETQGTAAAVIEQAAQVTLLRVVLPWMIGRAFAKIGDREFIDRLGSKVELEPLPGLRKVKLEKLLSTVKQKQDVGAGVQKALQELYPEYNLTGRTWRDLTQPAEDRRRARAIAVFGTSPDAGFPATLPWAALYLNQPKEGRSPGDAETASGGGLLNRGALRYQSLVPSYTVMFAFFLVLTVGWLFVAERRQGTLKRLRAAPLSDTQILFGKLVPCFLLSVAQGLFLLIAGKLVFGMSWGSQPLWLVPVVLATSFAATGLALLVAGVARTEAQVAVYGTLLVLVLAGVSGCLMGDPELMPESMKLLSRVTPHAWALDGYSQLLLRENPNLTLVGQACAVLSAFGAGFVALAWAVLRLD